MTEQHPKLAYSPVGWQNFDRRLTREELDDITRRISGIHFAKEMFADDPVVMQLLFAAEALQREVFYRIENDPLPAEEE